MCIAIVKNAGVSMPSKETLEICYLNNPDGAGYAIADGYSVKIRKGFMTFDRFWDALQTENNLKNHVVFLHFRIATHGYKDAGNTHPFPVTKDFEEMRILEQNTTKDVFMHNGIINIETDKEGRYSDTMHFIATISHMDYWHDKDIRALISLAKGGSRLAMMSKRGDVICWGDWKTEAGVMYSNESYKPRKLTYGSLYQWDSFKIGNQLFGEELAFDEMYDYDGYSNDNEIEKEVLCSNCVNFKFCLMSKDDMEYSYAKHCKYFQMYK